MPGAFGPGDLPTLLLLLSIGVCVNCAIGAVLVVLWPIKMAYFYILQPVDQHIIEPMWNYLRNIKF